MPRGSQRKMGAAARFAFEAGVGLERHPYDPVRTVLQLRDDILVRKVIRERELGMVRDTYKSEKVVRAVRDSLKLPAKQRRQRARAARRVNRGQRHG